VWLAPRVILATHVQRRKLLKSALPALLMHATLVIHVQLKRFKRVKTRATLAIPATRVLRRASLTPHNVDYT